MCDYSLMCLPNRLGREGEDLVVHRFPTGSLGFASPLDLSRMAKPEQARGFWASVRTFFSPPRTADIPAVCIPPGARLTLSGVPKRLQMDLGVAAEEQVSFTQLSAAVNTYRDAIRFKNGYQVRLQDFAEGVRAKVLDLSMAEEFEPVHEERPGSIFRR